MKTVAVAAMIPEVYPVAGRNVLIKTGLSKLI